MTKEYELQLKAWLAGEDYTDGLRLWKHRYGEDIYYRVLCLGTNDFNRAKMRAGLSVPMEAAPEEKPAAAKKRPGKVAVLEGTVQELESEVSELAGNYDDLEGSVRNVEDSVETLEEKISSLTEKFDSVLAKNKRFKLPSVNHPDVSEDEPEKIKEMRKRTYGLMDERTLQRQRLRDLPDPARREDRKAAAFRILDITAELDILFGMIGYWEEHKRVPESVPIEEQGIVFPKRYLNLRTYVSRSKKELAETSNATRRAKLEQRILDWEQEMEEIELDL